MLEDLLTWNLKYRALLILVPLVMGTLFASLGGDFTRVLILAFSVLWLVFTNRRFMHHFRPWIFSVVFYFLIFGTGYFLYMKAGVSNKVDYYGKFLEPTSHLALSIKEVQKRTEKNQKYLCEVLKVNNDSQWISTSGRVFLYIPLERPMLTEDDVIITDAPHAFISGPLNPYEFDYRAYTYSKGITGNVFAKDAMVSKVGTISSSLAARLKRGFSRYVHHVAEQRIDTSHRALFLALSVADKSSMDTEQKQEFARTGVMHLIALSGMHVAIVWMLIALFLRPIQSEKSKTYILLPALWLYAFLMGMSPSIVRAVALISVWKLASFTGRTKNSVNALLLIAAILLVYNPYWLMDVGFQLSFLATLSIIFFYPHLLKSMRSENKYLNWFTQFIAVTLAAQVLTMPLCLYYFHQFPAVFIISNLVGWLCTTALVPLNLLLIALNWVPYLADVLAFGINKISWVMLSWIKFTSRFQPESWSQIYVNILQTLLLYMMMIFGYYMFRSGRPKYVLGTLCCLISVLSIAVVRRVEYASKPSLSVYNISRNSCIDIFRAGWAESFMSPEVPEYNLQNTVQLNHMARHISQKYTHTDTIEKGTNIFLVRKPFKIYILQKYPSGSIPKSCDYILLHNSPKIKLKELNEKCKYKQIIADGSNYPSYITSWTEEAEEMGLAFYCTSRQGAFITQAP